LVGMAGTGGTSSPSSAVVGLGACRFWSDLGACRREVDGCCCKSVVRGSGCGGAVAADVAVRTVLVVLATDSADACGCLRAAGGSGVVLDDDGVADMRGIMDGDLDSSRALGPGDGRRGSGGPPTAPVAGGGGTAGWTTDILLARTVSVGLVVLAPRP
jgi:hypothetical protein